MSSKHLLLLVHILLAMVVAIRAPPPCVNDCSGIANGNHQSCQGCNVYATCSNGILYDNRPCPANLVWDDNKKTCDYTSATCSGGGTQTCVRRCNGRCITQAMICDGQCHCPGCSDELQCGGAENVCPRGTRPVPDGSGGSRLCNKYYAHSRKCPGPNDNCVDFPPVPYRGVCCRPISFPNVVFPGPPCCEKGRLVVGLRKNNPNVFGSVNGVSVQFRPRRPGPLNQFPCSKRALVKVDFEKIDDNNCYGCLERPFCGRRMLKIDLFLGAGRQGNLFNVGDSVSNNGYKGDSNHQYHDAEVQGLYPHVRIYGSDKCPASSPLHLMTNAIGPSVNKVTLYVSNHHVLVTNDNGVTFKLCSDCLFALNGQPDSQNLGSNERVYVALNSVVRGDSGRDGAGVCRAAFNWVCPACPNK